MTRDLVEIGYVARAHGIAGEVRVVLHNPDSTALDTAKAVFIGGTAYELVSSRLANDAVLVRLKGVADRNAAESLRGNPISVRRDELDLEDDEVLVADLVGCDAVLTDGTLLGNIVDVMLGPQELLVIHGDGVERLLPLVDEFVVEIDLERNRVTVAPPEGLPETEL